MGRMKDQLELEFERTGVDLYDPSGIKRNRAEALNADRVDLNERVCIPEHAPGKSVVYSHESQLHHHITKREYFAASALQGLLGDSNIQRSADYVADDNNESVTNTMASAAIGYADALIEELAK